MRGRPQWSCEAPDFSMSALTRIALLDHDCVAGFKPGSTSTLRAVALAQLRADAPRRRRRRARTPRPSRGTSAAPQAERPARPAAVDRDARAHRRAGPPQAVGVVDGRARDRALAGGRGAGQHAFERGLRRVTPSLRRVTVTGTPGRMCCASAPKRCRSTHSWTDRRSRTAACLRRRRRRPTHCARAPCRRSARSTA